MLRLILVLIAMVSGLQAGSALAASKDQILVTIKDQVIRAGELQQVIGSSAIALQFNTMSEKEQAAIRGDILKRLVAQRLLRLEAESQGLGDTETFKKDIAEFRKGLLYRYYIDRLRAKIHVPKDELLKMRAQYKGEADAYAAAKAAYITARYRDLKSLTIVALRNKYHVKLRQDRLTGDVKPGDVLLQGDGIRITYGDLVRGHDFKTRPKAEWIQEQLFNRGELELIARAAQDEGVDVSADLDRYRNEHLPALLLEKQEKKWIPGEATLRAYYDSHPGVSKVPARWHVGQLVLDNLPKAKWMQFRIKIGESLFKLAGLYSIDPYGRQHNGDMGWFKEGTGMPVIENAIRKLKDGEVSDVIKTPKGYHLVTVLERKPGETRPLAAMRDKVRQLLIEEKRTAYLQKLQDKYHVVWNVIQSPAKEGN